MNYKSIINKNVTFIHYFRIMVTVSQKQLQNVVSFLNKRGCLEKREEECFRCYKGLSFFNSKDLKEFSIVNFKLTGYAKCY